MAQYIKIQSGSNVYYYTGSTAASAFAGFKKDTGRSGSFSNISYGAFAAGLKRFGFTPPPPGKVGPATKSKPPPKKKAAPKKKVVNADEALKAAMLKAQDKYNAAAAAFAAGNPFAFDEELEKEAILRDPEFEGFYSQKLSDFLQGIQTQRRRSTQDEGNLLSDLKADTESFTGRQKQELDRAVNASREGFSDSGLFFSGQRLRGQGILEEESQFEESEFTRGQDIKSREARLLGGRRREDLLREEDLGVRGIELGKAESLEERLRGTQIEKSLQTELEKVNVLGQIPGEEFEDFVRRQSQAASNLRTGSIPQQT